jgi:hypothetical protein
MHEFRFDLLPIIEADSNEVLCVCQSFQFSSLTLIIENGFMNDMRLPRGSLIRTRCVRSNLYVR